MAYVTMMLSQEMNGSGVQDSKQDAEYVKAMCGAGCKAVCESPGGAARDSDQGKKQGNASAKSDPLTKCMTGNVTACLNARKTHKNLANYTKDSKVQAAWAIPCEQNGGETCLEAGKRLVAAGHFLYADALYWLGCYSGSQDSCSKRLGMKKTVKAALKKKCNAGDSKACHEMKQVK